MNVSGRRKSLFAAKVDAREPDACWPWTAARNDKGYGVFRASLKKNILAHRMAFILAFGPVPDGLCVLHRCDNPSCCNPSHLWVGSLKENTQDMMSKGRHAAAVRPGYAVRGERQGLAKLDAGKVREIRALVAGGAHQRAVADRFGVRQCAVWQVVHRKTWAHVD